MKIGLDMTEMYHWFSLAVYLTKAGIALRHSTDVFENVTFFSSGHCVCHECAGVHVIADAGLV